MPHTGSIPPRALSLRPTKARGQIFAKFLNFNTAAKLSHHHHHYHGHRHRHSHRHHRRHHHPTDIQSPPRELCQPQQPNDLGNSTRGRRGHPRSRAASDSPCCRLWVWSGSGLGGLVTGTSLSTRGDSPRAALGGVHTGSAPTRGSLCGTVVAGRRGGVARSHRTATLPQKEKRRRVKAAQM